MINEHFPVCNRHVSCLIYEMLSHLLCPWIASPFLSCFSFIDREVLYFLDINALLIIGILDNFSQAVSFLFFKLILVSSEEWKLMWLNQSLLFPYFFPYS